MSHLKASGHPVMLSGQAWGTLATTGQLPSEQDQERATGQLPSEQDQKRATGQLPSQQEQKVAKLPTGWQGGRHYANHTVNPVGGEETGVPHGPPAPVPGLVAGHEVKTSGEEWAISPAVNSVNQEHTRPRRVRRQLNKFQ